jgi:hypothetical protein
MMEARPTTARPEPSPRDLHRGKALAARRDEPPLKRRLLTLLSLPALLLFTAPAVALAATPAASGQACLAQAQPPGSTAAPAVTCYPTFAQSISAATGGRVSLPPGTAAGSVTPDQINAGAAVPNTSFVLSIDFVNSNFGGPSLTWFQSSKCGSFQIASMPSGWNDVISSVQAYNGCANTLYQNNNFGGTTFNIGRNGSAAGLGSFNDKTSSQRWCTASPCR